MSRGKRRYIVMVWNADGDMGRALTLGAFYDVETAEKKANQIRAAAVRFDDHENYVRMQAMVLDLLPGSISVGTALEGSA